MLRARDATDPPVAMRPLDARATCCGRTSDVLHEAYGTGTALGGAMGDASTAGDSATGGAITRARCKYTRENVRGRWLEMRYRLQASGVDAPLPFECPSLTIPKSFLATMMVSLPHLSGKT